MTWRHWLHGLIGAAIGGGANAITTMIIAPAQFNLQEGYKNVLMSAIVSAIVSAALYLKQSPLPEEPDPTKFKLPSDPK